MTLHQLPCQVPMHFLKTSNPKFILFSPSNSLHAFGSFPWRRRLGVLGAIKTSLERRHQFQIGAECKDGFSDNSNANGGAYKGIDLGWMPSFPHVLAASMSNFLFGYHIGVMNGPVVLIARELGFEGNSIMEGLVVSIFIAGAFIGSLACSDLIDKFGCRRTLQIDSVPLIVGAILRSCLSGEWRLQGQLF